MTDEERIEMLQDAQEMLREAAEAVREATRGTHIESRARSYTVASLEMLTSDDHEWLGNQPGNLQELIEDLQSGE